MPIPDTTHEQIIIAMQKFDTELRSTESWKNWEQNYTHKYAIEYESKQYPVKQILSMATGLPVSSFSGGDEANSYAVKKGFSVISIRENILKEHIEKILTSYVDERTSKPMNSNTIMWKTFDSFREVMRKKDVLKTHPHVKIKFSIGQGNWAKVPWIAFLDDRETSTTQKGIYCVLLFRQDGSGAYITFNQGVTDPIKQSGSIAGKEILKNRARNLRKSCNALTAKGFQIDDNLDLHAEPGLGSDYEASTIAYKFYDKGLVPNDEYILKDIEALLSTYDRYVSARDSLCLIGTGSLYDINNAKIIMKDRGAWASWWSFPIKEEAKKLLRTPFYLYINTGGGVFPFKYKVQEYEDSKGNDGILSPWPEITEKRYVKKSKDRDSLSAIFKTWFKVTEIESIDPPLKIADFEPAQGLSKENSLLNQSTFGYAYLRSAELPLVYSPNRYDVELAESQLRKSHDEIIGLEIVLDRVEKNFHKEGKQLKPNWQESTRKNIEIWFKK